MLVCLFLLRFNVPVNNFSVMSGMDISSSVKDSTNFEIQAQHEWNPVDLDLQTKQWFSHNKAFEVALH